MNGWNFMYFANHSHFIIGYIMSLIILKNYASNILYKPNCVVNPKFYMYFITIGFRVNISIL